MYTYQLSGGMFCTMNTRLHVNEGDEIKIASELHDYSLMDSDGKTYKCKYVAFADGGAISPQPKEKLAAAQISDTTLSAGEPIMV